MACVSDRPGSGAGTVPGRVGQTVIAALVMKWQIYHLRFFCPSCTGSRGWEVVVGGGSREWRGSPGWEAWVRAAAWWFWRQVVGQPGTHAQVPPGRRLRGCPPTTAPWAGGVDRVW